MTLSELKNSIEQRSVSDNLIIFVYDDAPFIADQYIREISKIKSKKIQYLESIDGIASNVNDIFGMSQIDDGLKVYRCKELENLSDSAKYETNLFIITNKIKDKSIESRFENYIVYIPKLEGWQLKDYMYSVAEGIERNNLDWLIAASGEDIYRLENELDKFRLFSETERKYLFNDMLLDGAFSDLSSFNVFNVTNAVTSRDYNTLRDALKEIKSFDAEPLGVVTLLYNGFKKLLQVWLAKNPTPENTGLKSGMIYAIKNQPRVFNKEQLLKSFLLLTSIDKKLKTGTLCDMKNLIDYVICRIMSY